MAQPKRYTITAALPYANGPLHIGHLAGAYLNADIYARYLRLKGEDVVFVCGSDEHGAAITLRAKKENTTPKAIVDKYHTLIKDAFEKLGLSFDIYHRTSTDLHRETAQGFFTKLYNKGVFLEKVTEQYYDKEYDQFLADRYITGTCPKCSYEKAYGDQCENCGSDLSPTDLIQPVSTLSGKSPQLKTTKHWYLPLNDYEPWLKEWIVEGKKDKWKTNVYGQCKSWIEGGLHARAMTRDLDWGVPVPLEDAEGKVLYVWLDAPIGYISATKQWATDNGKNWEDYWKNDETQLVHFIGKDNIVFHCITFPTILKAHGDYILPTNVPANEFMNLEGNKISTSRNWAVWAHEYVEQYPENMDEMRYTLIANMPETKDAEFTWDDFQSKVNNELVATLGNLENRVMVLIQKYWDGFLPDIDKGTLSTEDNDLIASIASAQTNISTSIESFRFREALQYLMELARKGNKYLGDNEPWKLIKTDETAAQRILYVTAQVVASFATLAEPFLPFTAQKIQNKMNLGQRSWDNKEEWLLGGSRITKGELLFKKIENELVTEQQEKLKNMANETASEVAYEAVKETINFEDFLKLDIRTGEIKAAEKIKKTNKLMKVTVDLGFEERTIVSGIAEQFAAEDLIGRKVSVIVNLAPRKLKGVTSQGMILMAEDNSGKLDFVASIELPSGMVIR